MRNVTDTVFKLNLELATDSLANIANTDFQYKNAVDPEIINYGCSPSLII